MAFGSKDLNSPDDQAKAIAVTNGKTFAQDKFTLNADSLALVAENKPMTEELTNKLADNRKSITEYIDKLNKEEKTEELALYNAAFEAKTSVLTNADDTAAAAVLSDLESKHKETRTSSYWLIFTYLILTFAELLLSPMGISFVSKVAPPKYKGMMMGGWFVATAIGNLLVAVGGFLWAGLPLWSVWAIFVGLCLISAVFMFSMMKKLENATK